MPFAIESALSGVMRPLGRDQALWYPRIFRVPAAWAGQRVLPHVARLSQDYRPG